MVGSNRKKQNREGIALVVVLGFLAILTLMSVGMAISMRTERLTSKSYLEMVKARTLCQAGLANAVMKIEEVANFREGDLGATNNFMPDFEDWFVNNPDGSGIKPVTWYTGSGERYGPKKFVLPSIATEVGDQTADIFTNLLVDYADTDCKPEGASETARLDRPSIEPVPMVNELYIDTNGINVEVWAPFVGPSQSRYTDRFEIEVELGAGNSYTKGGNTYEWGPANDAPMPQKIIIDQELYLPEGPIDATVIVKNNTGILDRAIIRSVDASKSYQCNDPRFNHLESQWQMQDSDTLGDINATVTYRDMNDGVTDGDYLMYCANQDLRCAGELGYLPVAPWRTIKLYEDPRNNVDGMGPKDTRWDMDPILDYFTMFPINGVQYGLISPNENFGHWRIPQAVFDYNNREGLGNWGMYLGDETEPISLNKSQIMQRLQRVGNQIVNISSLGQWLYMNNFFPGLPSLRNESSQRRYKRPDWVPAYKENAGTNYSELRIEHLMRRASALYNVRQNVYVVCIWAQSLGRDRLEPGNLHSYPVQSEAQAVAMVWRDPYPISNSDPRHRSFVRFMRWME